MYVRMQCYIFCLPQLHKLSFFRHRDALELLSGDRKLMIMYACIDSIRPGLSGLLTCSAANTQLHMSHRHVRHLD